MSQIRIKDSWDNLTKCSVEASNRGITYGKLMAEKYEKEQMVTLAEERARKREENRQKEFHCMECGNEIPPFTGKKRFCCVDCECKYYEREQAEEARRDKRGAWAPKKKKPNLYCVNCGKQLVRPQKKYCCSACEYAYRRQKTLDYMRRYYEDRRKNKEERHCIRCGKVITEKKRVKFCSNDCMQKSINGRRREKERRERS